MRLGKREFDPFDLLVILFVLLAVRGGWEVINWAWWLIHHLRITIAS